MHESDEAPAEVLIAFQLDCWRQVASAIFMSAFERNQARRKFLALIAKYPDVATEYGFSVESLAAPGEPTSDARRGLDRF